jgi:hypothetical protein
MKAIKTVEAEKAIVIRKMPSFTDNSEDLDIYSPIQMFIAWKRKVIMRGFKFDTEECYESSLEHCKYALKVDRSDSFGFRDLHVVCLFRLGRHQECYDTIAWWVNIKPNYDSRDTLPKFTKKTYMKTTPCDSLERLHSTHFGKKGSSLCMRIVLCLIKKVTINTLTDTIAFDTFLLGTSTAATESPIRKLTGGRDVLQTIYSYLAKSDCVTHKRAQIVNKYTTLSAALVRVNEQFASLVREVHKQNPVIWRVLIANDTNDKPLIQGA